MKFRNFKMTDGGKVSFEVVPGSYKEIGDAIYSTDGEYLGEVNEVMAEGFADLLETTNPTKKTYVKVRESETNRLYIAELRRGTLLFTGSDMGYTTSEFEIVEEVKL